MPGILGGGGGNVPAPTVNRNPAPGSAEFYTPQSQPGADAGYMSLLNNLIGQYTGGSTPGQQLYPGAQQSAMDLRNLASPGGELNYILNQINANPYYGGEQNAAGKAAEYTSAYSPYAADNVFSALQRSVGGQLQNADFLSGLPGQAASFANAQASLAPTVENLGYDIGKLAPSLMAAGSPLIGDIMRMAERPEGIGALQSGAEGVLDASRALARQPVGAGRMMAAGRGILDQGKALAGLPTGAGQLTKASTNLLNAGYDPQNALRNQLTQQTADQSSAINAMSGLGASPYGAGQTTDALNNFNINWQNQQLGRQQAALAGATGGFEGASALRQGRQNLLTNAAGAAGQAFGEASGLRQGRENLLTSGLGAAAGAFGEAGNLIANKANMFGQALAGTEGLYQGAGGLEGQELNALQGAGNLWGSATSGLGTSGALAREAAGIYGGLPGTAGAGAGALGDLARTTAGGGALPNQAFMGQQGAEAGGINNLINALMSSQGGATSASNIGNAGYALPESMLSSLGNYLKLGQNASLGGGQLGQIGMQNQGAGLEGLGSLFSGAGLGGLAFGSGGLGGAFGGEGLLGSFGGGLGSDFSSEFGAGAAGGSGFLGLLESLFA